MFILQGDIYLSDGVWHTVDILEGSMSDCINMILNVGNEYKNLTVWEYRGEDLEWIFEVDD